MTDILDLPEGPQVLATHGVERWKDSYVADVLRYYLPFIGAIPDSAWGDIPFAAPWKQGWATQIENRVTEATTLRNKLGEIGGNLIYAAAIYSDSDLNAAVDVSNAAPASDGVLQAWLDPQYSGTKISVDPNDDPPRPDYSDGPPENFEFPEGDGQDTERLSYLEHDVNLGETFITAPDSGPMDWEVALSQMPDTPGRIKLDQFIQEGHYAKIFDGVSIVIANGFTLDGSNPIKIFDECWSAQPKIIINRAELVHVVARNYANVNSRMEQGVTRLKDLWSSQGGAQAYFALSTSVTGYLDDIEAQATWLAEEGRNAGNAIDKLLLAYANVGYEHIGTIIEKMQAYNDAVNGTFADVKTPAEALFNALKGLGDVLLNEERSANDMAQAESQVADAADHSVELDSSKGNAEVFPEGDDGYGVDDIDSGWSPN